MNKQFGFYCISPDLFENISASLTEEERMKFRELVKETSNITLFSCHSKKLLFEDAMWKGFLLAKAEKLK